MIKIILSGFLFLPELDSLMFSFHKNMKETSNKRFLGCEKDMAWGQLNKNTSICIFENAIVVLMKWLDGSNWPHNFSAN